LARLSVFRIRFFRSRCLVCQDRSRWFANPVTSNVRGLDQTRGWLAGTLGRNIAHPVPRRSAVAAVRFARVRVVRISHVLCVVVIDVCTSLYAARLSNAIPDASVPTGQFLQSRRSTARITVASIVGGGGRYSDSTPTNKAVNGSRALPRVRFAHQRLLSAPLP